MKTLLKGCICGGQQVPYIQDKVKFLVRSSFGRGMGTEG